MQLPSRQTVLNTLLCSWLPLAIAADAPKSAEKPCSIQSTSSGSFFDLSHLQLLPRIEGDEKSASKGANESWLSRGYDYGRNFSLNICGPVVEEMKDVEGVDKKLWANVSAFYKDKYGDIISLGQSNDKPFFRGRKLLLNYTQGSLCPELDEDGEPTDKKRSTSEYYEADEEDEPSRQRYSPSADKGSRFKRRRTTMLSFTCDNVPSISDKPSIFFLGTPDHCTYIFEVKSRWACTGATSPHESGTLGPGGVFGIILAIAIAVYLIGGVVYQRSVMHQRGWRQLPNYGVWASLFSFFQDMFVIMFSSCGRCMPSLERLLGGKRGGYHRVGSDYRNNSFGRGRTSEDANRLIDSLDEEWD